MELDRATPQRNMIPKGAAKSASKPAAEVSAQATGRVTKSRSTSDRKASTSSKMKVLAAADMLELNRDAGESMDDVRSLTEAASTTNQTISGAAAPLHSASSLAVSISACDKVIQTPELLENILRFTGCKTLLTSVLQVNKHFNAMVTASPCLQKVMFESFIPPAPERPDPSGLVFINEAVGNSVEFPGTTARLDISGCCWYNEARWECSRGDHFLRLTFDTIYGPLKHGSVSTGSWRKLRVMLPPGSRWSCQAWVGLLYGHPDYTIQFHEKCPVDLSLGELYDWLVELCEKDAKGCSSVLDMDFD